MRRSARSPPPSTQNYADTHAAVTASSAAALDHGFQTALYVLTGLLVAGAAIVVTLMKPASQTDVATAPAEGEVVLDEAA